MIRESHLFLHSIRNPNYDFQRDLSSSLIQIEVALGSIHSMFYNEKVCLSIEAQKSLKLKNDLRI